MYLVVCTTFEKKLCFALIEDTLVPNQVLTTDFFIAVLFVSTH